MSKDKNNTPSLIEIRDILKGEMDKFKAINSEIIDNQSDFNKIGTNYEKYSNEIDKSKGHITQLKRREFFENLFVYIGFFFFFGCVAYVMLRRFPLHKIILFFLRIIYKMGTIGFKITTSLFRSNTTKQANITITNIVNKTDL